jgi:hypothetical protein
LKSNSENKELRRGKETQGIGYPLPKRLYTLEEGATYLGRTVWAMRGLVWKGSIPIVREGKRIFLDIADLDKYVVRNKTTYL